MADPPLVLESSAVVLGGTLVKHATRGIPSGVTKRPMSKIAPTAIQNARLNDIRLAHVAVCFAAAYDRCVEVCHVTTTLP